MTDSLPTVYELLEMAARPALEALPRRVTVDDLFNPDASDEDIRGGAFAFGSDNPADLAAEAEQHNAWAVALEQVGLGKHGELNETGVRMAGLMLRGPVRVVLSGLHEKASGTLDIRCYADDRSGVIWSWRPDGSSMIRGGGFYQLFERIVEFVPDWPEGRADTIRVPADAKGVIDEGYRDKVEELKAFLARERAGTLVLDLVAYNTLCSEYLEHAFLVIDNDLGRHVLATLGDDGPERGILLTKSSPDALAWWMEESVEQAIERRDEAD
ncbi:hypothetical protein [Amycolatopsis nigrescens]|uniref:hypothetical protein n=1 Tax=Amycolatopsis nigrescens TaxID=381445 RepID=UPI0003752BB0|nr:hypothetical protein [Amycolatopsis nigrescens]